MTIEKIRIPDFGDVQKITVVEVFIAPGDEIAVEASLIALESEKAVMDIPSPLAGIIKEVLVKEDDVVASGDVIALIETAAESGDQAVEPVAPANAAPPAGHPAPAQPPGRAFHASPSVRALAREQQVDLAGITGTGPGGRILREDILATLAGQGQPQPARASGATALPAQTVQEDFSRYGRIEEVALGRIKKIAGPHLQQSWSTIPQVTHFDEADITDLERFRKELNGGLREGEAPFSPLVFVIKAVAATLKAFPLFNSSLLAGGEKIALKKYYHLGIAVDTPQGLVVPVVKDADHQGLRQIAGELQRLSNNARAGKSAIPDLQGATFTISSLGGIGGCGFTPIVSYPQVAILGLSKSAMRPVWDGQQFLPRLHLPFSLSYDHRVIDGAEAARFCRALRDNIEDLKRILL